MAAWTATYVSMALENEEQRVPVFEVIQQIMTENPFSDLRVGRGWRMHTTKTGCNSMKPKSVHLRVVKTLNQLTNMMNEIEQRAKGPQGYRFPPQSYIDGSESPIIYLAFDPEFLQLTNQTALGIAEPKGGSVKWIDAEPAWLNHFSFIPFDKNGTEFAPMFSLSSWPGYGWAVDMVYVSKDEDRRGGRQPLCTEFPTKADRRTAPMRPNGPEVQRLRRMFTDKNKRYFGFAIANDMKFFRALFGIQFVQTPEEAGITAQNPQGHRWAMPYIDVQLLSVGTWPFKIAGYNVQSNMTGNDLPGLAPTAIACGSMENTFKQLSAIFVKVLELAKGGEVRDTDRRFLQFFRDMQTA